jgi:hypothetical protein
MLKYVVVAIIAIASVVGVSGVQAQEAMWQRDQIIPTPHIAESWTKKANDHACTVWVDVRGGVKAALFGGISDDPARTAYSILYIADSIQQARGGNLKPVLQDGNVPAGINVEEPIFFYRQCGDLAAIPL